MIHGKTVTLRAIEESDLELFHAWGNDPELWRLLGGWHFPVSHASTRSWFEKLQGDALNVRLSIVAEGKVVGMANMLDIDWKNRHAFHGMMLGPVDVRGKGIGRDTVMAVMRYAFDELGFARLDGSMIEYNEASLAMYCGKCAWKREGVQRNWYWRDGRYWDKIMVGVTAEDYYALLQETGYWS